MREGFSKSNPKGSITSVSKQMSIIIIIIIADIIRLYKRRLLSHV